MDDERSNEEIDQLIEKLLAGGDKCWGGPANEHPTLAYLETVKHHRAQKQARIDKALQAEPPKCPYLGCNGTLACDGFDEDGVPTVWKCSEMYRHGGTLINGHLER